MTFYVKQNDTSPSMLATLQDAGGDVINLTSADVRFHMRKISSGAVVVDNAASVVTADQGLVRYDWQSDDTASIGSYLAEFEVTYGDGTVETFPNDRYIRVEIIDDIA